MSKIFIVEDNPEMRMMMTALLTGAGHEVIEAEDGSDVLERSLQEEPDLVMLDVMMPVVDGWGALEALKSDHRTFDLPVIMVTAKKTIEDMERAEELGASDYLTKPWTRGELETRIRWALRKRSVPEFEDLGLPAGFFDCGCAMKEGETAEDHVAPDDCFGGQSTEYAQVI
jgi:DNA-binding response OmpR family regulator